MQTDPVTVGIIYSAINCLSVILIFALVLGFIALMRYFTYRETLALAEKGLVRSNDAQRSKSALRWGIVILAIGLALCAGLYPLGFNPGNAAEYAPLRLGPWMVIGFVPTFIGVALIVVHWITREKPKGPSDRQDS